MCDARASCAVMLTRLAHKRKKRKSVKWVGKEVPSLTYAHKVSPHGVLTPAPLETRTLEGMSVLPFVSDTFDPLRWREVEGFTLSRYHLPPGYLSWQELDGRPAGADMPVVRIAFDRPDIRNAFRPLTVR